MYCENCKFQRKIVLNKQIYPSCIVSVPEVTKKCAYVSGYDLVKRYGKETVENLLNTCKDNCKDYVLKEADC